MKNSINKNFQQTTWQQGNASSSNDDTKSGVQKPAAPVDPKSGNQAKQGGK